MEHAQTSRVHSNFTMAELRPGLKTRLLNQHMGGFLIGRRVDKAAFLLMRGQEGDASFRSDASMRVPHHLSSFIQQLATEYLLACQTGIEAVKNQCCADSQSKDS